jgi:FMN reductase
MERGAVVDRITGEIGGPRMLEIATVVGNPRAGSRTRSLARELTDAIAARFDGASGPGCHSELVDLALKTRHLVDAGDSIGSVAEVVGRADVFIAVSPTYRATYTGLLKLFLDRLPSRALAGKVAIPVMVGAAPIHALAVDLHLRPVLLELAASCPTEGLFALEGDLSDPGRPVNRWLEGAAPILERVL